MRDPTPRDPAVEEAKNKRREAKLDVALNTRGGSNNRCPPVQDEWRRPPPTQRNGDTVGVAWFDPRP